MKRLIFTLLVSIAATFYAAADPTWVKDLWYNGGATITWDWVNTKSFNASDFANVKVGDYIQIDILSSTGAIELKSNGVILPGTVQCIQPNGGGEYTYKAYITADMLASLKAHGLLVCGAEFKTNGIKIFNDGTSIPDGAIWAGYTWAPSEDRAWPDDLKLFKQAFEGHTDAKYLYVYHEAGRTNYAINSRTGWNEGSDLILANDGDGLHLNNYIVFKIEDGVLNNLLSNEAFSTVFLQRHDNQDKGGFNITSIVLRSSTSTTFSAQEISEGVKANVLSLNLNAYDYAWTASKSFSLCKDDQVVATSTDGSFNLSYLAPATNLSLKNASSEQIASIDLPQSPSWDLQRPSDVGVAPIGDKTRADLYFYFTIANSEKVVCNLPTVTVSSNDSEISDIVVAPEEGGFSVRIPNAVNITPSSEFYAINEEKTYNFSFTPSYPVAVGDEKNVNNVNGTTETWDVTVSSSTTVSGMEDVAVAPTDAPVEYYNLQGQRVNGELAPGCYIRRQGSSVTKVMIRF